MRKAVTTTARPVTTIVTGVQVPAQLLGRIVAPIRQWAASRHTGTVAPPERLAPRRSVEATLATAPTSIATVTELGVNKLFFTAFAAATLTACESDYEGSSYSSDTSCADRDEGDAFDEDTACAQAEQEVADEGYSGPCTIDCSGHDAGFNYAANGNPDGGVSDSQSFDEGQEAYQEAVDERVEELRQAHDAGEEE